MEVVRKVLWAGDHQEKGSKPENMRWFPDDRKGKHGLECEYLDVPLKEIGEQRGPS